MNAPCSQAITTETLSAWRSHLLPSQEQQALARHIADCAVCKRRLGRFDRIALALREPPIAMPSQAAIWRDVRAEILKSPGNPISNMNRTTLIGAFSTLVLLLISFTVFMLFRPASSSFTTMPPGPTVTQVGVTTTPVVSTPVASTPAAATPTASSTPIAPTRAAVYFEAANKMSALNVNTGEILWQKNLIGSIIPSQQPVVANGLVYFVGYDGELQAMDAHTGAAAWHSTTSPFFAPLVTSSFVYLTQFDNATSGTDLIALDAHTGAQKWKQATGRDDATPLLWNNTIWLIEEPSNSTLTFNAFDPTTGAPGQVITFNNIAFPGAPAQIINGRAYFPCQDSVNVCAVDLTTGTLLWQVNEKNVVTRVAYDNGMLYFQTPSGFLGINASSGAPEFTFPQGSNSTGEGSNLAQFSTGVVYMALNGTYYALDSTTGKQLWSAQNPSDYYYAQGQVYDGILAVPGHAIVALNATTGATKWGYVPRGSTPELAIAPW